MKYLIPGVILIMLILTGLFRWSVEAQSTAGGEVRIWKRDRWTGDLWLMSYNDGRSFEVLANIESFGPERPKWKEIYLKYEDAYDRKIEKWESDMRRINNAALRKKDSYTYTWYVLLAITAVWLIITRAIQKKPPA